MFSKTDPVEMELTSDFKQEYVQDIKTPAYVVKTVEGGKRGCVVEWNEQFERLTNFTPSEIDYKFCHELFRGIKYGSPQQGWVDICCENCNLRGREKPCAAKDLWINCKDQRGGEIKKLMDVYIFPFEEENNKFTLHILIDRLRAHSITYFEQNYKKEYDSYMKNRAKKDAQQSDKPSSLSVGT